MSNQKDDRNGADVPPETEGAQTPENRPEKPGNPQPAQTDKKPSQSSTPPGESSGDGGVGQATAASQEEAPAETDAEAPEETPPAPPKRGGWLHRLLYVLLLVVVSVVIAMFIISVFADRYGLGKSDEKIDIVIPRGANAETIAGILKKDGVINNPIAFRFFVRQNKISGFQAGTYTVNPSLGYDEIVSVLRDPDQNKNNIEVTVTEGLTLQEIADLLNKKGVCTQQNFLNALDAGGFDFPMGAQIPSNSGRFYKYEGYLFPDTYTLLKGSSGKAAAQKMFSNFSSKFTSAMAAQAKQRGMTVDQIITLASIIQKEAASKDVMADVSSTFYNRLRTGVNGKKLLQSDATVLYAKHDLTEALNSSDAALDSHYNTYRYEGLPPGPICNPGLDAINAALNPNNTNYLYFVSDANGKYYFANTFADHVKNVKKAAKAGGTKATGDLSSGQ